MKSAYNPIINESCIKNSMCIACWQKHCCTTSKYAQNFVDCIAYNPQPPNPFLFFFSLKKKKQKRKGTASLDNCVSTNSFFSHFCIVLHIPITCTLPRVTTIIFRETRSCELSIGIYLQDQYTIVCSFMFFNILLDDPFCWG